MLLGTVAAGALAVTARPTAAGPDTCVVVANVATCSGDQSGGIDAGVDFNAPPVNTLIINNLTRDVGPLPALHGIRWAYVTPGHGPINIISNTGPFSINVPGTGMNLAEHFGESITLNHTGTIQAGDKGIRAYASHTNNDAGAVSVSVNGDIVSGSTGIDARSIVQSGNGGAAAITVNVTGDIGAGPGQSTQSRASPRETAIRAS